MQITRILNKYEWNKWNGSGYIDSISKENAAVKLIIDRGVLSNIDPFR